MNHSHSSCDPDLEVPHDNTPLIPVAICLPTLTLVCSEERPGMPSSITGRPLICQSATSSAGENPVGAKPSPNFCFRFLLAKNQSRRFTETQQTSRREPKYWTHSPHCTMFLYLILTCCQVRFTLLGFALKQRRQRNS